MNTLYDLTHRHSGIIVSHDASPYVCDDWSEHNGPPHKFKGGEHFYLGEDVPEVPGHYFYNLEDSDIDLTGFDYGNRPKPERGMVYDVDGRIVICPDGWD